MREKMKSLGGMEKEQLDRELKFHRRAISEKQINELQEYETKSETDRIHKKKRLLKGIETRISMQLNELLEKNSLISGKI